MDFALRPVVIDTPHISAAIFIIAVTEIVRRAWCNKYAHTRWTFCRAVGTFKQFFTRSWKLRIKGNVRFITSGYSQITLIPLLCKFHIRHIGRIGIWRKIYLPAAKSLYLTDPFFILDKFLFIFNIVIKEFFWINVCQFFFWWIFLIF